MNDGNKQSFRLKARKLVLENRMFEVFFDKISQSGGGTVDDFLIIRPKVRNGNIGGVCVLPEVDGEIGLMYGYRHQLDQSVWQAPAGFMEPNEAPNAAALRELREEAGLECKPSDLVSLGAMAPDAGLIEATVALFVARNCVIDSHATPEDEPGTSQLTFFSADGINDLAQNHSNIGGATLVACFRWLRLAQNASW